MPKLEEFNVKKIRRIPSAQKTSVAISASTLEIVRSERFENETLNEVLVRIFGNYHLLNDLVKAYHVTFVNAINTRKLTALQDVFYHNTTRELRLLNEAVVRDLEKEFLEE